MLNSILSCFRRSTSTSNLDSSTTSLDNSKVRIYNSGSEDPIPPHPGPQWTRFVLISDTHSRTKLQVPEGDVLIHAGDLSTRGTPSQLKPTADWLCSLTHPKKIVIAGNHDFCLDLSFVRLSSKFGWIGAQSEEDYHSGRELFLGRKAIEAGIVYLEHEGFELVLSNGRLWKIFGSPCTPVYGSGAFQYMRGHNADEKWKKIPKSTEILITHGPPNNILGKTRRGVFSGCESLSNRLKKLGSLRMLVCGHIHEAAGHCLVESGKEQALAVNAATPHSTSSVYVVDLRN